MSGRNKDESVPVTRTRKVNEKQFELAGVRVIGSIEYPTDSLLILQHFSIQYSAKKDLFSSETAL